MSHRTGHNDATTTAEEYDFLHPPGEGEDGEEVALAQFMGRQLYNINTGVSGVLNRKQDRDVRESPPGSGVFKPYGPLKWVYELGGARVQPGSTLLDFANRALIAPSGDFNSARVTTASDAILRSLFPDLFGDDTGVSADTAASLAQRQREDEANRQFDTEQKRLDREATAELDRLREENALKRTKIGEAGSLARTAAEVQQRARQLIAELTGVDDIRAAIAAQGGLQRGTTPAQAFKGQLQGIAAAPIPTVSETSTIPEIEQIIAALQGQQQLPVAPALGFAHGGSVQLPPGAGEMQRGPSFSAAPQSSPLALAPSMSPATPPGGESGIQQGTTKQAVLVGEAGSQIAPGTEVMIIDTANPGRVEVIPLVSGAQEGATFDTSTIQQTLAPIFKSFGFNELPEVYRSPTGQFGIGTAGSDATGLSTARRLGFEPRLIRNDQTGEIYFRNPEGALQSVGSMDIFNQSGFQLSDVLNVKPQELAGEKFGSTLTGPPPLVESGVRQFPQQATPLISGTGQLLFDPRLLAGIYRLLDSGSKEVLASLFGTAPGGGGPAQAQTAIDNIIRFFTPTGTATRPGAARFG